MSKSRSPLRGMTQADLRMFRKLARAVVAWERAVSEGEYYLLPFAPVLLNNDGGFWQARVLDEMHARAWRRISRHPSYNKIREAHRVAHMRRYDSRAYEVHMLREEVAELKRRQEQHA